MFHATFPSQSHGTTRIVNLDLVKAFRSLAKGRLVAELANGTRLEVSRSKARELRKLSE